MKKSLKHDALVKKILTNQVVAREFLEYYLPADFKKLIDLAKVRVEKESFVTNDLKRQLSDIVYSIPTIEGKKAFVYCLIEHQSSSDYWIALRLWQYVLQLCQKHRKDKDKLPLICPIVIYANEEPYNAPKSFWELFEKPEQAKILMGNSYLLVDLQQQTNDEIVKKKHLGMMEYMLKYIHQRDMLKFWDEFLSQFKTVIVIDKELGYIYLQSFLWYTDTKISEEKQQELEQIIAKHLSLEEKEDIMRTIAQKYIDEGIQHGIIQGIKKGKAEAIKSVAKKMLSEGCNISLISTVTGLDESSIHSLLDK